MSRKLSSKVSVFFLIFIFLISLAFLAGIYSILNPNLMTNKGYSPLGGPVTSIPTILKLEVDQPDDDTLTFQSSIVVSGNATANTEVLISSQSQDLTLKSKTDGSFSTVLNLDAGVNNITIAVFDPTGESKSVSKVVYYSKEKI